MRWWRLAVGAGLLIWVLGTAYVLARRRGRNLGLALFLLGASIFLFFTAAITPRPPMPDEAARFLVIISIALLGLSISILLVKGFKI